MNRLLSILLLATLSWSVAAGEASPPNSAGVRVGLGQDSAREAPLLKNLRLTDPLVQQKYLNEPDMLRFLRATYSEGCSRGYLNKAVTSVKLDRNGKFDPATKAAAKRLSDSQRLWKMSSFELEALFGKSYLHIANYCDCLMKEVPDTDLVSPKKGIEVVEKIPTAVQSSCERLASEKTERQVAASKESKE